jgi:hypothetical protein
MLAQMSRVDNSSPRTIRGCAEPHVPVLVAVHKRLVEATQSVENALPPHGCCRDRVGFQEASQRVRAGNI